MTVALPSFEDLFDAAPSVRAEAPGRVNLIGEHTDYNGGFVLPIAIPQATRVELTPCDGSRARVWSAAFAGDAPHEFDVGAAAPDGSWVDYVKGMTVVLSEFGPLGGFRARIESEVPVGSGLSSSAALEIAIGRALREAFGLTLTDIELARAARRAENEFVGAPVGIMDQMACSFASPSAALFLDTRSLQYDRVTIPPAASLIVIDSGIEHRHAGGEYAQRRQECERAAAMLGVSALRDVNQATLERSKLPDALARRVRHVMTENQRVLDTVEALRAGDLERTGELFLASHHSLRDDFEVSVPDMDALVDIAAAARGVYGARLTGGGFGGSVVALAAASHVRAASAAIVAAYRKKTGRPGRVVLPD